MPKTAKPRKTFRQVAADRNGRQNAFASDGERIDGLTKREYIASQIMAACVGRFAHGNHLEMAGIAVHAADALLLRLEQE